MKIYSNTIARHNTAQLSERDAILWVHSLYSYCLIRNYMVYWVYVTFSKENDVHMGFDAIT
jgi:hypothetical protein